MAVPADRRNRWPGCDDVRLRDLTAGVLPVTTSHRAVAPIAQIAYRGHARSEMVLQRLCHYRLDFRGAVARNAIECHRPAVGNQMRVSVDQARQQGACVPDNRTSLRQIELKRLDADDLPPGYQHRRTGST